MKDIAAFIAGFKRFQEKYFSEGIGASLPLLFAVQ
jgi:hypothetical protein